MAKIVITTTKNNCAISKDYRKITRNEICHLLAEIENIKMDLMWKYSHLKHLRLLGKRLTLFLKENM